MILWFARFPSRISIFRMVNSWMRNNMRLFLAFRNLFRNIRRTVAVLLTIALGAGALLSFGGFIKGVLNEYRDKTIHSHYGFGQINTQGYRDSAFQDPVKHWIKNGDQLEEY